MNAVSLSTLARFKRPLRYVMGALYVVAGVMHFVVPSAYAGVIPPLFPQPLTLVYLSGIAEIVLGVGVMVQRTQRLAAWGLIALLVAVFPANVYMATSDVVLADVSPALKTPSTIALWLRLPMQGVLIAWAWWYTQ
nr:DoxX family membrane protein [Haloferax larsenii]